MKAFGMINLKAWSTIWIANKGQSILKFQKKEFPIVFYNLVAY